MRNNSSSDHDPDVDASNSAKESLSFPKGFSIINRVHRFGACARQQALTCRAHAPNTVGGTERKKSRSVGSPCSNSSKSTASDSNPGALSYAPPPWKNKRLAKSSKGNLESLLTLAHCFLMKPCNSTALLPNPTILILSPLGNWPNNIS